MIPNAPQSDQNPASRVPWPSPQGTNDDDQSSGTDITTESDALQANKHLTAGQKPARRKLTTWDLITLSVSMGGAQIAWTVELGYGTPFLLSIGLPEQLTSLVWLAGPISGLVAQPVIGALSDSSTSKYRRRFWIMVSTIALVVSTFTLAYCRELAAFLVDFFGDGDVGRVANTAIGFAVVSFYVLDFALNGLQASLRNLLLDVVPPNQLSAANAWHGRMTNAGNIVGFGFGFLPLEKLPLIRLLGGGQFRKFCIICIIILVATVAVTCVSHEEEQRQPTHGQRSRGRMIDIFNKIRTAVVNLPKPIRRVCYVQLFAFMGWFPFLFYSTTYVGQIMAYERQEEPNPDVATRTGAFAMLIYSVVGVTAGFILPHLAGRDRRLMAHKGDDEGDAELSRLRETVRQWRVEAARQGKPLRLPMMPFLLRNIWTGALIFFTMLTLSTFFISTVVQASVFISLVGICWAVAMWAPFAIIMEFLKESSTATSTENTRRPGHTRNISTPGILRQGNGERQPLLRRRSYDEFNPNADEVDTSVPLAGGTVLGIHNLAIVMPQFIVAMATSIIFRIVDGTSADEPDDGNSYLGKNGVAWVLRFGGLCTLFGAVIARMVPPTPTEKAMRRRLGEMKLLGEEASP